MNHTYDYIIAGISLRSYVDLVEVGLRGFKPFEHEISGEPNCTFELKADLKAENYGTTTRISTCYLAEADCNSELHKCFSVFSSHLRWDRMVRNWAFSFP